MTRHPSEHQILAEPPSGVVVAMLPAKGRGLVACAPIVAGTRLFSDPVVVIDDPDEIARLEATGLNNWLLYWGEGAVAIAMGWTMLINHSRRAELRNVTSERDHARRLITIIATRDIAAGEELLFDYELSDHDLAAYGIPLDA